MAGERRSVVPADAAAGLVEPVLGAAAAAAAPAGCYWAKLDGAGDILDNDFRGARGSLTVVIDANVPFFESSGCGTWTRR